MAEVTPPLFMDVDNAYSGDELGVPFRFLAAEGVVGLTALEVTERAAGANLSVDVAAGWVGVAGDTNTNRQPLYWCFNDAVVNLGISPDPSDPRKVLVVAQVTDEGFSGTGREWELLAIHGTPAASPTVPSLPDSALPLAIIDVPAADTAIADAQITDVRKPAQTCGGAAAGTLQVTAAEFDVLATAAEEYPTIWDGFEVELEVDATDGVYWRFRYRAASASTYKWEFVGGPDLFEEVVAQETTTSSTYTDLSTSGPTATVPRPGEYDVEIGARMLSSGDATTLNMSYAIGATTASDDDRLRYYSGASNSGGATTYGNFARLRRKVLATAVALTAKYRREGGAGSADFAERWVRVRPIRIS